MATAVIMPRQGQSVESCIIATWHKKVGDKVEIGDMLFTYETDKSTFDEEAKEAGTMLAILFEEGDDVPCLENVCVIGNEGENISEFVKSNAVEEKKEETVVAEVAATVAVAASPVERAEGELIKISPRAKMAAQKANVDYRQAGGTGPAGRIVEKDIEALIASGTAYTSAAFPFADGKTTGTGIGGRVSVADLAAAPEAAMVAAPVVEAETWEEKLPSIRKAIAKRMHASLSTMAQLTLNTSFDATEIMAYRSKIKANQETMGLSNITLNDIVLYAVSRILPKHPAMNAHFYDDKMVYFKNVQLGMAVDTARGLMVPTIFNANKKSLNEIAAETKALAGAAQGGTISPDSLKGGSFTVTNLGALGIESFTPVINPPQTGILGVDTIVNKPKEVNGVIKLYPSMGLSLTFDHRAVDGAPAAKFLKELAVSLENFSVMLAK